MRQDAIRSTELLSKLVSFDTTSKKSNLGIISFIEQYLADYNISSQLIPNDAGDKASLFATIGPKNVGGLGLSAHTDVVPAERQEWTSDPFQLRKADGRLFGRGTCDMKGFLACVLAKVPEFLYQELSIPIHLIFSYDEEVGCTGVRPLISKLGTSLTMPELVIVGEPTSMKIVDSHKSVNVFTTKVTGQESHSSSPHSGVNAIMFAAELITQLSSISREWSNRPGGERFDPPFTTVHVGTVKGGAALNIVPRTCEFIWEFRGIPGIDETEIEQRIKQFAREKLLPQMRAVSDRANIEIERINQVPAFRSRANSPAVSLALKLAEQNETGAVSYGTEAGLFENADCPAVICGPGNIEQAHKPDKYITLEEIDKCLEFLDRLITHVRATGGR